MERRARDLFDDRRGSTQQMRMVELHASDRKLEKLQLISCVEAYMLNETVSEPPQPMQIMVELISTSSWFHEDDLTRNVSSLIGKHSC